VSKNIWNCFSECKHGGNTLDFIARMESVSIHQAAMKAIEWFDLNTEAMSGVSNEEGEEAETPPQRSKAASSKPASAKPSAKPETTAPNKALKFRLDKLERNHPYLTERGLTQETVIDFGIGFCAKGMMADHIAIPIHNSAGEVVAYAGRFPGEPAEDNPKYKLPQGFRKSLELFNIDRAIKEPANAPLVIVEGFFDCMKLHQLGCHKVVALMGSTMSAAQEEIIRKHTTQNSHVIVMLDEDEAGLAGREDIAVRLVKSVFIKVHMFRKENMQPDQLTAEEIREITGGIQ